MLATFQLGEVLLSILWFFLFVMWFMILFHVFGDLFRDHTLSGWGKAAWIIFIILLPLLGTLVYVIARGKGMSERTLEAAKANDAAFKDYVQQAAGTGSPAEELTKLAALKDQGVLTEAEFEAQKTKLLA